MSINPENVNTIRVGELVPSPFSLTDNIPHEVGTDLTRGTIAEFIVFLAPLLTAIQYEVKTLHVNQAYIDDNFNTTGLGINLMAGYAICNGNNGTVNKDGKVGIAYGANYSVIGATGGSETHTLNINQIPSHTHTYTAPNFQVENSAPGSGRPNVNSISSQTSSVGGGQPHNNMQPYIVELHVMKL